MEGIDYTHAESQPSNYTQKVSRRIIRKKSVSLRSTPFVNTSHRSSSTPFSNSPHPPTPTLPLSPLPPDRAIRPLLESEEGVELEISVQSKDNQVDDLLVSLPASFAALEKMSDIR